jgi:hypothetical protein
MTNYFNNDLFLMLQYALYRLGTSIIIIIIQRPKYRTVAVRVCYDVR